MKKTHFLFVALTALLILTTAAITSNESPSLYEKTVIIELDAQQDSAIFTPYSKAWNERWEIDADLKVEGSSLMNYDKYTFSFKERTDNLFTILHPMIINGTIQSYYPFDPESYGSGPKDDGELRFPTLDMASKETFVNSEEIRESFSYFLGKYGPMSDIPLYTEFGEDSIIISEDGTINNVYAPRDFYWHTDESIVKYKLRVKVFLNKKGIEKKRIVEAICPVVHQRNEAYEIVGEEELLWLKFEDIAPTLKKAYFIQENWKPQSYLNYIQEKVNGIDVKK